MLVKMVDSKRSPGKRSDTRDLVRSHPASRFAHAGYSLTLMRNPEQKRIKSPSLDFHGEDSH
jgi:hypothetical protein